MAGTTTDLVYFARKLLEAHECRLLLTMLLTEYGAEVINSEQYFMLLTHSACPFAALLQEG